MRLRLYHHHDGARVAYRETGTGPAIVMDLVIRNRNMKSGAVGYVAAGLFVAVLWSICSGLLVLDLVLQLKETLA